MNFLCLANSWKHGGRCVAGIVLDNDVEIQLDNKNNPVWVRPVFSENENAGLPISLIADLKVFDSVCFSEKPFTGNTVQPENIFFDESEPFEIVANYKNLDLENLLCFFPKEKYLLGNNIEKIRSDEIMSFGKSLNFIKVCDFSVEILSRETGGIKKKLKFSYNNEVYKLTITDPIFCEMYDKNNDILENVDTIYIVVSLGTLFKGYYYKLVASIFY